MSKPQAFAVKLDLPSQMRSLVRTGWRSVDVQHARNGVSFAILPRPVEACGDFHNDRSCVGGIVARPEAVGEAVGAVLAFDPIAMRYRDFLDEADALHGFLDGGSIGILDVSRVAVQLVWIHQ